MTLDAFKHLIEEHYGPLDNIGMLGELVATVENMMKGGSNLLPAVYNAAQEMRDTLASIQQISADDLEEDDEGEDSDGDDVCDNCHAAGVSISQTCPECGKTLCAECAAENEGFCGDCEAEREET